MSKIDLGRRRLAVANEDGSVSIWDWLDSVDLEPDKMDALCRWWLEQREQQAKEKVRKFLEQQP